MTATETDKDIYENIRACGALPFWAGGCDKERDL
jgi:hypothetical protein